MNTKITALHACVVCLFQSQYVFLHQCILDSLPPEEKTDEHIYENTDMIYANAAALYEFQRNTDV